MSRFPRLTPVAATALTMGLAMTACLAAGIAPSFESLAFVAGAGILSSFAYALFPPLDEEIDPELG